MVPTFTTNFLVIAGVAELDRSIIKERTQVGVDRARKQGKAIGRPKAIFDREKARSLAKPASLSARLRASSASAIPS